jgi:hypothetical protein
MEARRIGILPWNWVCVPLLCLIAAATSFAQAKPEASAPPIEVLKLKWEKEVRLPRDFDPSVISTGGTFSDPGSRTPGPPTNPSAAVDVTRPSTSTPGAAAGSNIMFPTTPGGMPVFYIYSIKIRNSGDKQIKGIAWDYVFIDPNGGDELARHPFLSYLKAEPNQVVTLKAHLRSPLRTVSASSTEKHPKPIERASIQCVWFEDETVWRNPAGRKGVCEFLKTGESLIKQKPRGRQ